MRYICECIKIYVGQNIFQMALYIYALENRKYQSFWICDKTTSPIILRGSMRNKFIDKNQL